MRISNLLLSIFCLPLIASARPSQQQSDNNNNNNNNHQQVPLINPDSEASTAINAAVVTPLTTGGGGGGGGGEVPPRKHTKPTLADLLTIESSSSIFYTYARELELSARFSDENSRLTIFVPTNKAVMALARKPHQGPPGESGIGLSQSAFERKAKKNVERWVSAHIIPEYSLSFDSNPHKTLLEGKSISFRPISDKNSGSDPEWKNIKLDNEARITKKKEGRNGDLYIIDGVISVE